MLVDLTAIRLSLPLRRQLEAHTSSVLQNILSSIEHHTAYSKKREWLWPALTLLCSLVLFLPTLSYPFNNDNTLYAYMADLALHGRTPYTGTWDQNFPGVIWVQAFGQVIFGRSQVAFHVFDIILQLGGSYCLYRIGERLFSTRAGFLAATFVAMFYLRAGFWMAGERDTYVTILLLLALLLWLKDKRRAASVVAGLTVVFRPTYALYPLVFALLNVWDHPQQTGRLRAGMQSLALASIPTLAIALGYALSGGLKDLYEATLKFNFTIYSGSGESFAFWEPIRFYAVSVIPAIVGSIWVKRRFGVHRFALLLLLFLSGTISLIVLYRHSIYHYHPAMTMFLLAAAIGWCRIIERASEELSGRIPRRILLVTLYGGLLSFTLWQTLSGNTFKTVLVDALQGRIHNSRELYSYYEGNPLYGEAVQHQLGEYLRRVTKPGEPVQMFGPYSYPQYFAQLSSASRFQTLHALTMRGSSGKLQDFQVRWRKEYLHDLDSVRPRYFIVCDGPEAFRQYYGGRLGHQILNEDFTEVRDWLSLNYVRDTALGAFTVYALK